MASKITVIENSYNKIAKDYNKTIAIINSLDDWVFIKHFPQNRQRVLDIGCGSGHLLVVMSGYFEESYGIDKSKKMVELTKAKNKKFEAICGDAEDLPYPDNFFDDVVSHTVFQRLNKEKALKEAKRVLRRGGKLVIAEVVLENNKIRKIIEKFLLQDKILGLDKKLTLGIPSSNRPRNWNRDKITP